MADEINKKIVIIILTHGKLAEEFVKSAQLIIGKSEDIFYINFLRNMSVLDIEKNLKEIVEKNIKNNIIIFTDLFGGSCFNVAGKFVNYENIEIFTGVNMPLLIETIMKRESTTFSSLIEEIKKKRDKFILNVKDMLSEK